MLESISIDFEKKCPHFIYNWWSDLIDLITNSIDQGSWNIRSSLSLNNFKYIDMNGHYIFGNFHFFLYVFILIHRRKKIQNDDSCVNRPNIDVMKFVLQYVNHRMKSTLSLSLYGKWMNIQLWMEKKFSKQK